MKASGGQSSSFSGFLEGYSSSKLNSMEGKFLFHINEITLLSKKTINTLPEGFEDIKSLLRKAALILEDSNSSSIITNLTLFGEALQFLVYQFSNRLKSNINVLEAFEQIIVHFMTIARMSEDSRLISLGVSIGSRFKLE